MTLYEAINYRDRMIVLHLLNYFPQSLRDKVRDLIEDEIKIADAVWFQELMPALFELPQMSEINDLLNKEVEIRE